jgi:hypothetical protein
MKIAVGSFGYVIPHIVKVDEAKYDQYADTDDEEPYSFLVTSVGPRIDKVYAKNLDEAQEKRKKLVSEINQYYGEPLDI